MPVAPSFDDLLAQFEAEALAQLPSLQLLEGDVSTAIQHGAAAMADANIRFAVQAFRETFIDGAKDDALAALVDDHLNIQKQVASASQATLVVQRTGGGGARTMPTGFTVASQFDSAGNTVTFTFDTPVVFGVGDNGPHSVGITAVTAGRSGNVGVGLITRPIDALPDPLITFSNPATAGGGNDVESDAELRVRARNFWQALRRGTLAALEFGVLKVPTIRVSKATEDPVSGIVTLVVSDSDGNSTAQMLVDAEAELENWRAASTIVTLSGGTQLLVNVIGQLVGEPGVDTSVLGVVAADAIRGRILKLVQGERLYLDSIKAAALGVDPDSLVALVLSTPLVDVVPTPTQVIRPGIIVVT